MPVKINVDIEKNFEVECPYEKVFGVLADVPLSVSHFPKVDQLVDVDGEGTYQWEMEKMGTQRYSLQVIYASKYINDKDEGWVQWTPVDGVGNVLAEGSWNIEAIDENHTHIDFTTKIIFNLPFPSLAKIVVAPFTKTEFKWEIDAYLKNLGETFNSGMVIDSATKNLERWEKAKHSYEF